MSGVYSASSSTRRHERRERDREMPTGNPGALAKSPTFHRICLWQGTRICNRCVFPVVLREWRLSSKRETWTRPLLPSDKQSSARLLDSLAELLTLAIFCFDSRLCRRRPFMNLRRRRSGPRPFVVTVKTTLAPSSSDFTLSQKDTVSLCERPTHVRGPLVPAVSVTADFEEIP